jgi:hypothetical protein
MRTSLIITLLGSRFGVIPAAAIVVCVPWLLSDEQYFSAAGLGILFVICVVGINQMVESDRSEMRRMAEDLRKFETMRFADACAKVAEASVPIPGELARMREFPSPPPSARHRYFEREEVVFRVEETPEGLARFEFQSIKPLRWR